MFPIFCLGFSLLPCFIVVRIDVNLQIIVRACQSQFDMKVGVVNNQRVELGGGEFSLGGATFEKRRSKDFCILPAKTITPISVCLLNDSEYRTNNPFVARKMSTGTSKFRVGILGVAGISSKTAIAIGSPDSDCVVTAVASRDLQKAKVIGNHSCNFSKCHRVK